MDEFALWPELADARARAVASSEVLQVYPDRGAVPPGSWYELISLRRSTSTSSSIAGLFLSDGRADLPALLERKAERGRGDPAAARRSGVRGGRAPRRRGAGRRRDGRAHSPEHDRTCEPAFEVPGVEVRLHDTTLYNSIFRFDDDLLVNMHAYGAVAAKSPVMHVRRIAGGRLFPHYMRSFERVWDEAQPLVVEPDAASRGGGLTVGERIDYLDDPECARGEQPGAVGQRRRDQRQTARCC